MCDLLWPEPAAITSGPLAMQQLHQIKYIVSYQDPTIKHAIRNNKFHFHQQSAKQLSTLFDQYVRQYGTVTIIPIPSGSARKRRRGFEHLHHILNHSQHHHQVQSNVLKKVTNPKPQSHVSRAIRLQQQRGAFACHPGRASKLTGTVILFDDVVTTGATMEAAEQTLRPHVRPGVQLICLAIAH